MPDSTEPTAGSLVQSSQRLFVELGASVPLTRIIAMLRQCATELRGVPDGARPELVERLARERLSSAGRPAADHG